MVIPLVAFGLICVLGVWALGTKSARVQGAVVGCLMLIAVLNYVFGYETGSVITASGESGSFKEGAGRVTTLVSPYLQLGAFISLVIGACFFFRKK